MIATDVGACREMIEGRSDEDRRLGPSGIVTRVAAPKETAAALVRLARDVRLRRRMGAAGHQRVTAYYQRQATCWLASTARALRQRLIGGVLMAGIGWKLQRMIDRGSLAGTIGAYLTGVAVTSAPWLLTTAVLTSLRLVVAPRDRRLRRASSAS